MNTEDKLEGIAREIFTQTRTLIVLNMRFLDMAVFRLRVTPGPASLATDGERLYFDAPWLLRRYREEQAAVTRDYMHTLLHCVFRHPFVGTLVDAPLWDLACDIAVEQVISGLNQPFLAVRAEPRRQAVVHQLMAKVKPLTAEKLYHYFQDHPPEKGWMDLFRADDHSLWHSPAEAQRMSAQAWQRENGENQQNQQDQKPGTGQQDQKPGTGQQDQKPGTGQQDQKPGTGQQDQKPGTGQQDQKPGAGQQDQKPGAGQQNEKPGPGQQNQQSGQNQKPDAGQGWDETAREKLREEWRDISEHVQMDLSTFARERGAEAGDLQQQLAALNRERYDYTAFLKKFAVMGEAMKINDDEFDYIFYTYGLKRYGNMPLIEPLEYREVKRIRDFVIAIDTSGSTSGELVQRFLTKTFNILMSTESFFSRVNIHIVQCDAAIQEAVKVTSREEFEAYLRRLTIRGLGGTDFRPVFAYVDEMLRRGEFQRLKGLIYFTDGCGTYPERKPDYDAAFVFVQDEFNDVNVPPWAIRLVLEKEEI